MHTPNPADREAYKNVWVVAEVLDGQIQSVTHELLGAARRLADKRGGEVWCVVMGAGVAEQAPTLFHYQADTVVVVDDPALKAFVDETESRVLSRLIEKHRPEIILCAATTRGRALIPRAAVVNNCGLTADCTGLDIDEESGVLLQTRPAFGGNIMATIKSENHRPQMATVRPRVMQAPEADAGRTGTLLTEAVEPADRLDEGVKTILEVVHDTGKGVKLSDAQFIVTGGRGVKGPEGFQTISQLAEKLGAAVGASRAAVDAGWIPYAHQVGQTGQTVQAKVYMACGVSGQIQHLVGMQSCDFIVAINKDPDAPLMQLADVAVVGDLFQVIPELIKQLPQT
jgi:electron transfer flavoprotein alpha subunit